MLDIMCRCINIDLIIFRIDWVYFFVIEWIKVFFFREFFFFMFFIFWVNMRIFYLGK